MNWYPAEQVHRITEISPEHLKELGIKGIILDIDNTLTTHDNPVPSDGVARWLSQMRENDFQMIVLSNNHAPRVEPFAEILGLDYISEGKKPLVSGYERCSKKMGLAPKELCMIGDQILTDIWGGNRFGCYTVLTEPIQLESMLFFKFKRWLERMILSHAKNRRRK